MKLLWGGSSRAIREEEDGAKLQPESSILIVLWNLDRAYQEQSNPLAPSAACIVGAATDKPDCSQVSVCVVCVSAASCCQCNYAMHII